jgi:FtsP/CotA-like multicopper oxidase with cupredoxin domain
MKNTGTVLIVLALLLTSPIFITKTHSQTSRDVVVQPEVLEPGKDFRGNWLIDTEFLLAFQEHEFDINGDPLRLRLRTFGIPIDPTSPADPENLADWKFSVPGPTFWFPAPGENLGGNPQAVYSDLRFRLKFYNGLPEADTAARDDGCNADTADTDIFPNCFHGDNTTNVHYHGSHTTPRGRGDNVLVKIKPGETFLTDFFFGSKQAPGTHWYHPHKHGSTALQVSNGLAGAIIIEGDFDVKSINPYAEDLVFVVQYITDDLNFWMQGGGQPLQLIINGEFNPTVKMRPGEIQRWRFINANQQAQAFISFTFGEVAGEFPAMYQIAQDGVQFSPERWESGTQVDPQNPPKLAPGNRADYLVVAPQTPGTYEIIGTATQPLASNVDSSIFDPKVAFTIEVTGTTVDPNDWKLPDTLPDVPEFLATITDDEIDGTRELLFSMERQAGNQPSFYIDGKQYSDDRVDQTMKLNTAEEWKIINDTSIQHPFHIHINPFQIVEIYNPNAANEDEKLMRPAEELREWRDTIALPPALVGEGDNPQVVTNEDGSAADPGYVIIRHRFEDFTGDFVLHCHILGHEDRGMMQRVRIEP